MQAFAVVEFAADLAKLALPDPVLMPGQVLIRNVAAGVNNIDLLIHRGGVLPPEATPLPHVLGVEGAGIIEAVGEGMAGLAIGDRVLWLGTLGAGGYGPLTAIDAAYVSRIPGHVSFEMAAATPVAYATARMVLFSYGARRKGDWLLVHSAAGGVGTAIVQVARNAGFRTVALTSAAKLGYVAQQGADVAIDRNAADLVEQIKRAVGKDGVALSLNAVGGGTIAQDLEVLGDFGQIVSFGHLGGPPSGSAADLLMPHFGRSVGIRVSDLYTLWRTQKARFAEILSQVSIDLAAGLIKPQVDTTFRADQAADAHAKLRSGAVLGKLVLRH